MRMTRTSKALGIAASMGLVGLLMGCDVSTANISSADLGTGYANGKATNPTKSFQASDHEIHMVVGVANAPDGTKVSCGWGVVNAGGVTDQKLISTDVTLGSSQSIANCKLTNANDWPTGSYKVDLSLNDKLDRTVNFDVS